MLRFLKVFFTALGVVLVVATVVLTVYTMIQVNHLWTVADAAAANPNDPRWLILLSIGAGLIGGLILGLGLALPSRTYRQRKAAEAATVQPA